ncbi:hypothetical protein [Tsukamurella sp. 1534]|uniref:hypothetical protein n=1 Tax=Tsukamurella sp. 1534 TaxID=1151061 RepID=UPI00031C812F|nr:hypothetical protein [Tsukamurella sp. 1534]
MRLIDRLADIAARFGEFRRTHLELIERHQIMLEPWTHDVMHWGADGTLHGTVIADRARLPVTRGGWCPCRPTDTAPRRGELPRTI